MPLAPEVALRHKGPLRPKIKTLPEMLAMAGYATTCVGFSGRPTAPRGFDTYLNVCRMGELERRAQPQSKNLNEVRDSQRGEFGQ
jgi:hypothetical protein